MVVSQARSNKTATGSRYVDFRKKKQYETGREPTLTKIGTLKKKTLRGLGANQKVVVLDTDIANVMDKKSKKSVKVKILSVKANPANANYVRRNIITKGCTVTTDKGDVVVTSRPGQDGTVNGYLI
ncbi:30S ribosomal protein S8e [Candidatus Woesearchaeota archaeon]|nr:30S ribosomal protein S8e [Candidatus Woesearchaeota archaeon]